MTYLRILLTLALIGLSGAQARAEDKPAPIDQPAPKQAPVPPVHCDGQDCLPPVDESLKVCDGQDCTLAPPVQPAPEIEHVD